jgi:pimeloyl-ACP methyl ester carboxylesterase
MNIDIDGLNINYINEGNGRDVLLLHGWGGSIQTMIPILNILKDRFRVTVPDLPGFGESDTPKKPWNSYDYAECIYKLTEKLNLKKLIIFGHSHGGRISIILSGKYNLAHKLILIDSAGIISKRTAKYYIKVYWFKLLKKVYLLLPSKNKKEKLDKFYKKYGSRDYRDSDGIMRQTMVKVINDNLISLLKLIKAPALLIWGENDEDTPVYMGKIMEENIPDSGLVILKGAGHYSYIDNYEQFKAIINVFLKEDLGE